jgi:HTH-type transcriptional regulator / antitoxin HipB
MSNELLLKNLGDIIRFHREKSGLTRIELAQLAAVGKTAVFDIENSKKTIRLTTLLKILDVINIRIILQSPLMNEYEKN